MGSDNGLLQAGLSVKKVTNQQTKPGYNIKMSSMVPRRPISTSHRNWKPNKADHRMAGSLVEVTSLQRSFFHNKGSLESVV